MLEYSFWILINLNNLFPQIFQLFIEVVIGVFVLLLTAKPYHGQDLFENFVSFSVILLGFHIIAHYDIELSNDVQLRQIIKSLRQEFHLNYQILFWSTLTNIVLSNSNSYVKRIPRKSLIIYVRFLFPKGCILIIKINRSYFSMELITSGSSILTVIS